ncbi:hypothetical protein T484DRAFT_1989200 [Baffinella frigidus]|nr:hypothetical protein T484DRAFT_1989200 [Cryptophyta sp. CCMP2293]
MKKTEINMNRILLKIGIISDPYDYKIISGFFKIELNKTMSGKINSFRKFKSCLSFLLYNTRNWGKSLELLFSLKQKKPTEEFFGNLPHTLPFISKILYNHTRIIYHYFKKKPKNEKFFNLNLSNLANLFHRNNSHVSLDKLSSVLFIFQPKKLFCSNIYFLFFKSKGFILQFLLICYEKMEYRKIHEFYTLSERTFSLSRELKNQLK